MAGYTQILTNSLLFRYCKTKGLRLSYNCNHSSLITYQRSRNNSMCKVLCTVSGVNHYLNSNQRKNLARTFPPIFYVLENFRRKFAKVVAPPTDRSAKCLVLCKHIWSSNRRWKQRQNRSIIGDTISFLKLVNIDQKLRFGIWRFVVAPSDAAEKNCNIGAQL